MHLLNNKFKSYGVQAILLIFVAGIFMLMMMHDYLTSVLFNQSYYLSESLVFKTNIVLLVIPILISGATHKYKFSKEINVTKLMLLMIPSVIIHILIASLLIAFISHTLMRDSFTFEFLIKNKFNQDFIFLLTIYGLMFLISRYYAINIQSNTTKLTIKSGKQRQIIHTADIDWITAETPYVGIWTNGKKYLYSSTLTNTLSELNNDDFVRIHRSTIVNVSKIEKIVSRANGDYDLYLYDNTQLRLSRNYRKQLDHDQLKF